MKIWLIQMEPELRDKAKNLSKINSYLDRAVREKVNLIVFPELGLTGYMCRTDFLDLAEAIPGPSTMEIIKRTARENIYVILGMPERREGWIYNSAALIGPGGIEGVYRKLYLPNHVSAKGVTYEEKMFFKAGNEIVAFKTEFGTIGIEICYDIWFPEIARALAMIGAWLIFNISAAPAGVPEAFRLLSRARAMENVCYFGLVNQVGLQGDVRFGGGSCLAGYLSEMKAEASIGEAAKEEVLEVELTREEVERHRFRLPVLRNVRPDIAEEYWKISKKR
jgi:predicted amidohydrolase